METRKTVFSETSPLTTSTQLIQCWSACLYSFLFSGHQTVPSSHRGRRSCSRSASLHRAAPPAQTQQSRSEVFLKGQEETRAPSEVCNLCPPVPACSATSGVSPICFTTYPETGSPWRIPEKKSTNVYPKRFFILQKSRKHTTGARNTCLLLLAR